MQVRQEVKRILFQNIFIPLALGILSTLLILIIFSKVRESSQMIQHTDNVIQEISDLRRLVSDAQAGVRGYIITENEIFLDPYINAKAEFPSRLKRLTQFTSDNTTQQSRVAELSPLVTEWFSYTQSVLDSYRNSPTTPKRMMQSGEGERRAAEIRTRLESLTNEELSLKATRNTKLDDFFKQMALWFLPFLLASSGIIAYRGRKSVLLIADSYENRLQENREQLRLLEKDHWIRSMESELSNRVLKSDSLKSVCFELLSHFFENFNALAGAVYIRSKTDEDIFTHLSSLGLKPKNATEQNLNASESLFSRAIMSGQPHILREFPRSQWNVESASGTHEPQFIFIAPILFYQKTIAVIELVFTTEPNEKLLEFSTKVSEKLGGLISNELSKDELRRLYLEIQAKSDELVSQQEELRVSNEELEARADLLRDSQNVLESKNTELEEANELLQNQARNLEEQKFRLDQRNKELIQIRSEIEAKGRELERISQYKSQFLANMSHELRTPLNSSMILAQLLAENKDKNLKSKQVEYAKQILKSGQDLLALINDILDLSRVESGKLEVHPTTIKVQELLQSLKNNFELTAKNKGIAFNVYNTSHSTSFVSDRLRIEQILSNLVSNAIKFTATGEVNVHFSDVNQGPQGPSLKISVEDTGIGIDPEKSAAIFEPFRQADGSITRLYGGTGLGLSISRQLAHLLNGTLSMESTLGKGSIFTLFLPAQHLPANRDNINERIYSGETDRKESRALDSSHFIEDDRSDFSDRPKILVVEDDPNFASLLRDHIRERGYNCIATDSADEGLSMIESYRPSAVVLDINLPDLNGLSVLEQIKSNPAIRHLPVHIVSIEDHSSRALKLGAEAFLDKTLSLDEIRKFVKNLKPLNSQKKKNVLVIEDDLLQVKSLTHLFNETDINLTCVTTAAEAKSEILKQSDLDCVILDLKLPDATGIELLRQLEEDDLLEKCPPVIIHTAAKLSSSEELELKEFADSVILKGSDSQDRLIDELSIFLHHSVDQIPAHRKRLLEKIKSKNESLSNRRILIVDDDVRNIFALTASLEQKGAKVEMALNGVEAIKKINGDESNYDIILMDIMMPVMDGLEAIQKIRTDLSKTKLPIIALTAKAMKNDRELCLKAGANDYLPKPIDVNKLTSLIQVWTNKII